MHSPARRVSSLIRAVFAGLGISGAIMIGAQAAEPAPPKTQVVRPPDSSMRTINLGAGRSIILDLPRETAEIFVGDPKIVSAVVRSATKLYLIASAQGQTSIYARDGEGNRISEIQVSVGRDVGQLEELLRAAMPDSKITARSVQNTIILGGSADSAGEAQMAFDIASGFLGQGTSGANLGSVINTINVRGRDQVMLKVTIAEIQRSVMKQLGVTEAVAKGAWGSVSMGNALPSTGASSSTLKLGDTANLTSGLAGQIATLERNGVARVLAEPTVTAISGESAKFTAGGEIPLAAGETCNPQTGRCTVTIAYKPYGVNLTFTPIVLGEGRIQLRVATDVTEVDPTTSLNAGSVSAVGFKNRKNETTVELPSGGSIVTAGLIQQRSEQSINGLPGLMNLPVLGALFRSREYKRQETELMIIVTPYLARPVKAQEVARPADGFSDPTDPQAILLGRVNRLYSSVDNPQVIKNFKGKAGFITD